MATQTHPQEFIRFKVADRVDHALSLTAFTILALTGLPQKFSLSPISQSMMAIMGGIETVRVIHRVAATVLMIQVVYHLVKMVYKLIVLRLPPSLLPSLHDLTDLISKVAYNLGIRKQAPRMGRYNYEEKLEYWAFVWGTLVMVLTGFMMWNPIATTHFFPGEYIPAAKAAHGGEALLAVLAIIIWHFYSVHIRHLNLSMFTGKVSRHLMEEDHAAELADIEAGDVPAAVDPLTLRKRLTVFIPAAAILSIALLAGIVWFVTFEQTAITTIPAQNIQVLPPELQGPQP